MIIILILIIIILFINYYEPFVILHDGPIPPKLFVYCDKHNIITHLCKKSIYKHCPLSFDIVYLTPKTISYYLQEKTDNIKYALLEKYGGLYLEPNVLVLQNPIIVIDRLQSVNTFSLGNSILASNKGPITSVSNSQFTDKYDSISLIENKMQKDLLFLEITNTNYNLTENDLLFSNTTLSKYLRKSLWLVNNNN